MADPRFDVLIRTAFVSVSIRTRQRPNPCVSFENPVVDHGWYPLSRVGGGTKGPTHHYDRGLNRRGETAPIHVRVCGAEKGNVVQAKVQRPGPAPPSGTEFGEGVRQIGWTVIRLGTSSSSLSSDALSF